MLFVISRLSNAPIAGFARAKRVLPSSGARVAPLLPLAGEGGRAQRGRMRGRPRLALTPALSRKAGEGAKLSQKHPPVPRYRLRQMLGDRADAAQPPRVLVGDEPVGAGGAAVGQNADEVLEAAG